MCWAEKRSCIVLRRVENCRGVTWGMESLKSSNSACGPRPHCLNETRHAFCTTAAPRHVLPPPREIVPCRQWTAAVEKQPKGQRTRSPWSRPQNQGNHQHQMQLLSQPRETVLGTTKNWRHATELRDDPTTAGRGGILCLTEWDDPSCKNNWSGHMAEECSVWPYHFSRMMQMANEWFEFAPEAPFARQPRMNKLLQSLQLSFRKTCHLGKGI